jgi:hypothetical protein
MKRSALYISLLSLALVTIISCSGSSGKRGTNSGEGSAAATDTDSRPAKRLIEVLGPADNASFPCTEKIIFSTSSHRGTDDEW